jgi:ABC-type nickel/cobalt efflux system permease component RcnA
MITIAHTVATSSATADAAYYICIVSFFIAGGVAIYLLWDRTNQHKANAAKARTVRPSAKKRAPAKKAAAPKKKTTAKKAPAKKPVKRTAKKK